MDTACQRCHALRPEPSFYFFSRGATAPSGPGPFHNQGFTITLRHTTLGSTPLDERSARRRGLNQITHNTYNRHLCPRRDSKSQYQQASGRRPTP